MMSPEEEPAEQPWGSEAAVSTSPWSSPRISGGGSVLAPSPAPHGAEVLHMLTAMFPTVRRRCRCSSSARA